MEIWAFSAILSAMRNLFLAETCKETQLHVFNPQSWLQVERGKVSNVSSHSPSSMYVFSASLSFFEPFGAIFFVFVMSETFNGAFQCSESFIKVAEPPVLPFFKPIDYV